MSSEQRHRGFVEEDRDLEDDAPVPLIHRLRAAASMLQISETTLKSYERESQIVVPRRSGAGQVPVREYSHELLFQLAAWRRGRGLVPQVPPRPITIAVHNQKGGVGKTLLAVELATKWQLTGLRVLVIDTDAQFNTTMQFGYDPSLESGPRSVPYTLLNLLALGRNEAKSFSEVVKKPYGEYGPHLIPANFDLSELEYALGSTTSREYRFSRLLRTGYRAPTPELDLTPYDIVLFDTPPSTMTTVINALVASDYWLIPVTLDRFSVKGLTTLLSLLEEVSKDLERNSRIYLIPNRFNARRSRIVEYLEQLQRLYPDFLIHSLLPESEAIPANMGKYPMPVSLSSPLEDVIRVDLTQLSNEILERFIADEVRNGQKTPVTPHR